MNDFVNRVDRKIIDISERQRHLATSSEEHDQYQMAYRASAECIPYRSRISFPSCSFHWRCREESEEANTKIHRWQKRFRNRIWLENRPPTRRQGNRANRSGPGTRVCQTFDVSFEQRELRQRLLFHQQKILQVHLIGNRNHSDDTSLCDLIQ